jgi:NADPH-dependent 2,4-dienoyl-CoA reductase/sulfur reductase-like enzyme
MLMLRTLDESRAIEQRIRPGASVAIIGGGFIGLEVAAALRERGCRVVVIEVAELLLPRLGCAEASRRVLDHHCAAGIDIRLSSTVVEADGASLHLSDGTALAVDFVVAGIGVIPETGLASAAGLEVNDGIVTDEFGRTSDPDIFAAGDVTRHYNPLFGRHLRLESWQNANAQAAAAGRTMVGSPTLYAEVPWVWSDQGELNLQMAGAPFDVDETILRRGDEDGLTVFQFSGDRLVGGVTVNRGQEMTPIRRMLLTGELADDRQLLADPAIPLRRFIMGRAAA